MTTSLADPPTAKRPGDVVKPPNARPPLPPVIRQVTVENFRCFKGPETARLAPLTLLVGDNSTGKTSFLALVRALWDVLCLGVRPDFRDPPFDLGSFDDTAYNHGPNGPPDFFHGGLSLSPRGTTTSTNLSSTADFIDFNGFAWPELRRYRAGDVSFEASGRPDQRPHVQASSGENVFDWTLGGSFGERLYAPVLYQIALTERFLATVPAETKSKEGQTTVQVRRRGSDPVLELLKSFDGRFLRRPYASAPTRSEPRRTYDPILPRNDPEGLDAPSFLSNMSRYDPGGWRKLQKRLNDFGKLSGLFDRIEVEHFRPGAGSPFRILIRPVERGRRKAPYRNLADVGYGVSQVLPVLTATLRPDPAPILLLQQPEIHLHPSARAAVGSLTCAIAEKRQVILETHSDYIMDRIRMDIRDRKTSLHPEDVAIVFFERKGPAVRLHSIQIDKDGNVMDAPKGYRDFFYFEVSRSMGL